MKVINKAANQIANTVISQTMDHIDKEEIDILDKKIQLEFKYIHGNLICEAQLIDKGEGE